MSACVENEREVTKVFEKEIIDGNPCDNTCIFLVRGMGYTLGFGDQLILFHGQDTDGKPNKRIYDRIAR
jgi:hypothetical protein